MEIKEILLKHFIPENYQLLKQIQTNLKGYESKKHELNKTFESEFQRSDEDTLQSKSEYNALKASIESIMQANEEKGNYKQEMEVLINQYSLLSTYSEVLVLMFQSLKSVSKLMHEVTYSWQQFKDILDSVVAKIVKDLSANVIKRQKKREEEESSRLSVIEQSTQNKAKFSKV